MRKTDLNIRSAAPLGVTASPCLRFHHGMEADMAKRFLTAAAAWSWMTALASAADPTVTIEPVAATLPPDTPTIPWVAGGDEGWHAGKPLFELAEQGVDITAKGWLAVSDAALLWHVVVSDPHQVDPQGGANMWAGDALQLGVEALGDSEDEAPKGKAAKGVHLGPHDGDYCIARSGGKAAAWSYYHARGAGAKPQVKATVERDDSAATTTYDFAIPWTDFDVAAGMAPSIKVALQINNDNKPGQKIEQRLHWGEGVGGQFVPQLFHRLALGAPSTAVAAALVSKPYLTGRDSAAEILLSFTAEHGASIAAVFGGAKKTLDVPAGPGVQRFAVRGTLAELPTGTLPFSAKVSSGGKELASATQRVYSDSAENWYAFTPKNDYEPSVVGMADWADHPAGKHGAVQMKADALVFEDGTPAKFWGVGRHSCRPPAKHEDATALAESYEKWGINAVRNAILFSPEWNGIGDRNDTTKTDAKMQDQYDFLCAEWKKHGVYHGISSFWTEELRPADKDKVANFAEAAKHATALDNFAEDIQDLRIAAVVNFLKHKNPYTGLTYAEDPAFVCVEIRNEQDVYWYNVAGGVAACPTYAAKLRQRFCDWLKTKKGYADQAALVKAWGDKCIGTMAGCAKDESLDHGSLNPLFGAWWFGAEGLANQEGQFGARQRLLDSAQFLFECQTAYYERFAKAVRETGYKGVIVGGNWQAGDGVSHLYNLLSDRAVGYIDRHNYFGGGGGHQLVTNDHQDDSSMLWRPGRALLSTGLQQIADRPFGMSEWCAMTPNEWIAEGPVLMGFYGMGLQGWDALYFSFGNYAGFSPTLADKGGQVYNAESPTQLGLFPTVARALQRGDIKQGGVVASRRFTMDELRDGKLNFAESVNQSADVKELTGDAPMESLAAGRVVLELVDKPQASLIPDLKERLAKKEIVSDTRQLRWRFADHDESYVTVDTPGTQGVAGFTPRQESFALGDATIALDTPFAVVLASALGSKESLANAKSVLVTAIARERNTGMVYTASRSVPELGKAPILLEPVFGTIAFKRKPLKVVLLDHDGKRTERTAKLDGSTLTLDGTADQTPFYEVVFAE
jgi:hypothetical protein